jgi:hypothetical protein
MVIYSTAVDIGKKLKDPRQCDYLYNGCPVPYLEILKIITLIRKDIKEEDETVEMLSREMVDYLVAKAKTTAMRQHTRKGTILTAGNTKIKSNPSSKSKERKQQQNAASAPSNNNSAGKRNQQQQQQSPITSISHTLPNGEKVEINVQLSGNVVS